MFHTKSVDESLKYLDASVDGLTSSQAQERIEHYGKNLLQEAKKNTLGKIFIDQFKNPIIYVLLIAAIVSFAIKEFTDSGFIMAVLLINAIIGTFQEYTAGQKADALKKVLKSYVNVLRDSQSVQLLSQDVTVGDIVFFDSGVRVPADIRLIQTNELFLNESLLTGESIDVKKDFSYISNEEAEPLGDRKNMLYAGSMITKGRAMGVVTAVANQTQVGKIASLLASSSLTKAPLVLRMEKFSLKIAKIMAVVILIIATIGVYQDLSIKDIFFFSVAVAVSAIPEGLPVAITVALSVASAIMSKRNVIVRKLSAIEGLGSCTLIASDKTGTMTQNLLEVEKFITPEKTYEKDTSITQETLYASLLCNEANIKKQDSKFDFMGDQVDIALARYALNLDAKLYELKKKLSPLSVFAYEPENKYSGAIYEIDGKRIHFIKGSPEVILEKCNIDNKDSIYAQVDMWASKGFRDIALAYKYNDENSLAKEGYTYLGFACIADALREGVKESVKTAQNAGIEVVMVTGDHPNTALFIAKDLGIAIDKDEVMDGLEISKWQEKGAPKQEIQNKRVFARVSPEQKQLIVKTFQDLGHFVAVTGDGINDAPALKFANIGIAMGKSGTDVARESSDLILTDDSFGSIVNGIQEGRVAYDNIRKVIHLLISTGFAEIILVLLSMFFFIPIPLLAVQLLWLNLVTNGIQHIALGLEKAEPDVLKRKARDPNEPIFNKAMISRVVVGGFYMGVVAFITFYSLLQCGYQEDSARNITLLLMVLFENVHVFNSKSEKHSIFKLDNTKNKFLWISVICAQGIHVASMHIPFMQNVLNIQPVNAKIWSILLAIALTLMIIMEIEKYIRIKIMR